MASTYESSIEQANRAIRANLSPRYRRLDRFEQYVETTQYDDGRKDWFVDDDETPLRERRPCIQYPIVAQAVDSNTDLCLGEGRFPNITLDSDDDTEEGEGDDDGREVANAALVKMVKVARLKSLFRESFSHAQGCGTTLVICGFRFGRPTAETERAKWTTPTFSADGKTLKSVEVCYPYTKEEQFPDGSWRVKAYLYRRVIDEQRDITYLPIEALETGRKPSEWREDKTQTFAHGLGFCPVVWYPFMAGCSTVARFDGRPIHARTLDEIFAHDVSLSQRHRAAFFCGDPQIVLKNASTVCAGVGRSLQAMRETAEAQSLNANFIPANPEHKSAGYLARNIDLEHQYPSTHAKPALKKSPGQLWQLEGESAEANLLTLPGDALKAIDDDARDLRNKICDALAVVFTDPESVRYASALSGKAQKLLKSRQLDRCDQYRDDMGDGLIIPVMQMLIRIMQRFRDQITNRVLRAGIEAMNSAETVDLDLQWGDYWTPDPDEELKTAQVVNEVEKSLPLTDEVKARKLARVLDVSNPSDLVEQIEVEREERALRAAEQMKAQNDALHEMSKSTNGPVGARAGRPAGEDSEEGTRSRGSDSAPPPPPNKKPREPQQGRRRGGSR